MLTVFVAVPLVCGLLLIMYAVRTPGARGRDSQGKLIGLMVIVCASGLLLVLSSYNGLLKGPLQSMGLASKSKEKRIEDLMKEFPTQTDTRHQPASLGQHIKDALSVGSNDSLRKSESEKSVLPAEGHPDDKVYGIMFDAGSTGSRIHVFRFYDDGTGKRYNLEDDLFIQVKPGLSAYADQPTKGAESLVAMLESAKKAIPQSKWATTPIALKATAGLRLLPKSKADALLNAVRKLFQDYEFKEYEDSVVIMEGLDEGVFSWATVNFLKGKFPRLLGNMDSMQGVIDLGGGSVQVTFTPTDQGTIQTAPDGFLQNISIFDESFKLYSHSYLGLGLMSARLQTIGGKENNETATDFESVCLHEDYSDKWSFGSQTFNLKGKQPLEKGRFGACMAAARNVVDQHKVHAVTEFNSKHFLTISYFYDTAVDTGIIKQDEEGIVSVETFYTTAKKECTSPRKTSPFLCLDLCYLTSLLHYGFGIDLNKHIQLQKRINEKEISWALGAMFDFFSKHR